MASTYGKLLAAALAVSFAAPVFAAEVDHRQEHQQRRIAEGVESGRLTRRETARLEHREARTRREIRRDRAMHGGRLTRAERAQIHREQNRTSYRIYRAKHNHRHV